MFSKINKILILGVILMLILIGSPEKTIAGETTKTCVEGGKKRTIETSENSIWADMQKCRACGDCELNDFIRLGVNIFNFVLAIVGALALLAFMYGGFLLLLSGGNSETIENGKKALVGAVIGLVIIFSSYIIVNFTAQSLGAKNSDILNTDWNK